ncbi:unnamed protein product [Arabidopsis halleri]
MARLASWGLDVSTVCSLCSASIENRDHLFLECAFARFLWKKILERIGHPQIFFSDWNSMLVWVKVNNSSSPLTLRLLIIHTLVYNVWRQRNNLLHNQITVPPMVVFKDIDRQIINTITARRHMKNFKNLMRCWLH